MIKASLEILELLYSITPFLFSLILYTILAIALAKSIKKSYKVYYWVFGIVSFCFIFQMVMRLCGVSLPFNLGQVPILGQAMTELSSAANFIHPVLVIIMYMGAFSPKVKYVGRLMSIRKELSIIVGFPVLAHALKRIIASFPKGWQFFADNETYMQNPRVYSAVGEGITSFVFVLGIVMTALFLILWITSFDSVHRKMGAKRWKSVQKWSYGLYAMLFIHSLGLLVGGLISDNARERAQLAKAPKTEIVAEQMGRPSQPLAEGLKGGEHNADAKNGSDAQPKPQIQHGGNNSNIAQNAGSVELKAAPQQVHGGKPKGFSFSDIEVSRATKRYINIFILFAVYGSYLYFRVRRAREKQQRRSSK